MLRSNLLLKFFNWKKHKSNEIVQYNSNLKFDLEDQINHKIKELDEIIAENSKALFEAQIVKLRSNLSKSNNFIEKIGENVYKLKLEESINWHQRELKELYCKRKESQNNLEKIQGVFWLNRIKRLIAIIFIGVLVLIGLFIFLSGFMISIYLMPLIILIILGYLIANKKY